MGGLRYVTAGILLAVILSAAAIACPPRSAWGPIAVVSFFMLALGNGGVVWAEQSVPSGLTAVLIGTTSVLDGRRRSAAAARRAAIRRAAVDRPRHRLPRHRDSRLAGHHGRRGSGGRNFGWGVVAVQIACAGWAVGSAYTRRHVLPADMCWDPRRCRCSSAAAVMLIAGTVRGEWAHLSFNGTTTAAFVYLTLAGSVVAFAAYSYALKHLDVAVVSLYTYVNPVIAVVLGTLLLGEPFHMRMIVAAGVILVGMVTVGKVRSQRSEVREVGSQVAKREQPIGEPRDVWRVQTL